MNQHLDRLDGLAQFMRAPVLTLLDLSLTKLKRPLMVVSGWRSVQEQLQKWQQGRTLNPLSGLWTVTDASLIITKAAPGTSAHNVISRAGEPASLAVGLIPLHEDGSADWTPGEEYWDDLYELSWKVGLDPLGDLTGAYLKADAGHFEEPAWKLKIEGLGLIRPMA